MAEKNETVELQDIEAHLEKVISTAIMVPMGNPNKPDCRWGLPCIFWGLSGIGKSARIEAGCSAVGLQCEVVYPGTRQPEDFAGVVVPTADGIKIECLLPAVRRLVKAGKGLLFIDEASCAPPAVQGAALSLLYERTVGDTRLPGRIRILLAANPPEYAAGGWGLEAPFANRIGHFKVGVPTVQKWTQWLMSEEDEILSTSVEDGEAKVQKNWSSNWPKIKGALAGFMQNRTTLFHQQPDPNHPQSGLAWPSPRTWVMAGRAVSTVRCLSMPTELEQIFVEGLVGEGPAVEWAEWAAKADLPDPKDVLQHGWKIEKTRLDKCVAVATSIVAYVTSIQDKDEKIDAAVLAWNRFGDFMDASLGDIIGQPAQIMIARKLGRKGSPDKLKKAAEPVIYRFGTTGMAKYVTET